MDIMVPYVGSDPLHKQAKRARWGQGGGVYGRGLDSM